MSNLLFSSNANYLKTFTEGSTSFSLSSGASDSATVSHDLGYVPFIKFYTQGDDGLFRNADTSTTSESSGTYILINSIIITSTNFTIAVTNTDFSNSRDLTVYYKIYYDKAVA